MRQYINGDLCLIPSGGAFSTAIPTVYQRGLVIDSQLDRECLDDEVSISKGISD